MGKSIDKTLLWKIAGVVKVIREKKGITQEVFYNDTGINIGRIERAQRNISITTIAQICSYLEISMTDFIRKIEKS